MSKHTRQSILIQMDEEISDDQIREIQDDDAVGAKEGLEAILVSLSQAISGDDIKLERGWIAIGGTKTQAWLSHHNLGTERKLVCMGKELMSSRIFRTSFSGCSFSPSTRELTLGGHISGILTTIKHNWPGFGRGYIFNGSSLRTSWKESDPINLNDYASIGLEIVNIDHLVPPDSGNPYNLWPNVSSLVGEIPAIQLDLRDPKLIRFAHDNTRSLRRVYHGVRLICQPPLETEWQGNAAVDLLNAYSHSTTDQNHGSLDSPPSNYAILSVFGLNSNLKDTGNNKYRIKACRNSFGQVFILVNARPNITSEKWTLTTAWSNPCPPDIYNKGDPQFNHDTLPLLSTGSLAALRFLPTDMRSTKVGYYPHYLAGIGDSSQGKSIPSTIGHPLRATLDALPPHLLIGGMLDEVASKLRNGPTLPSPEDWHRIFENAYGEVLNVADGTIRPWSYIAGEGSVFPLHQEDAALPSANQLMMGDPKVWVFISSTNMDRLREKLAEYLHPCYPLHRGVFIHPSFLLEEEIPFNIGVQSAGDLILADASAGHEGWNTGRNFAQAANYADPQAIEYVRSQCYNKEGLAAWPCVCGEEPVPTPDGNTAELATNETQYYDPSWPSAGSKLACSTLYRWMNAFEEYLGSAQHGKGGIRIPSECVHKLVEWVCEKSGTAQEGSV